MTEPCPAVHLCWRDFSSLSIREIYSLLQLRQQVFVVEQQCAYLDADDLDQTASHLLCHNDAEDARLLGCLRLLPPGSRFSYPAIGRLATVANQRGKGLARRMMHMAIERAMHHHPGQPVALSAQCYLIPFYQSLGFLPVSAVYEEDGIPHIDMLRNPSFQPPAG